MDVRHYYEKKEMTNVKKAKMDVKLDLIFNSRRHLIRKKMIL
jgi:hypothetical protein